MRVRGILAGSLMAGLLIILISLLALAAAHAQDDYSYKDKAGAKDNTEELTPENINRLRPGMELRRIGGINMVVPQGAQIYRQGSMLIMEEDGDYSARRFKETDDRLNIIDEKMEKMMQDIAGLTAAVEALRKEGQ